MQDLPNFYPFSPFFWNWGFFHSVDGFWKPRIGPKSPNRDWDWPTSLVNFIGSFLSFRGRKLPVAGSRFLLQGHATRKRQSREKVQTLPDLPIWSFDWRHCLLRREGTRLPKFSGIVWSFPNLPDFPRSSPAAYQELLSVWILRATQKVPRLVQRACAGASVKFNMLKLRGERVCAWFLSKVHVYWSDALMVQLNRWQTM